MAEQTFAVAGLRCQGCVETISNALNALQSVRAVSIDLDTEGASTVRVSTETELTNEQVEAALKDTGSFTVVG
jgi:copper chaperone CopZ